MSKIIFFDIETTGLDPKVNGMHQLGGEIVIDGEQKYAFNYFIRPFKKCEIEKKSMEISNTRVLDLRKYNEEFQVMYIFSNKVRDFLNWKDKNDKFFLAGWRAPEFDVKFLQEFFEREANSEIFESLFWARRTIDVKTLAIQYFIKKKKELKSFSLSEVAKELGLPIHEEKLHKAGYDAYLCRKIYEIVTA